MARSRAGRSAHQRWLLSLSLRCRRDPLDQVQLGGVGRQPQRPDPVAVLDPPHGGPGGSCGSPRCPERPPPARPGTPPRGGRGSARRRAVLGGRRPPDHPAGGVVQAAVHRRTSCPRRPRAPAASCPVGATRGQAGVPVDLALVQIDQAEGAAPRGVRRRPFLQPRQRLPRGGDRRRVLPVAEVVPAGGGYRYPSPHTARWTVKTLTVTRRRRRSSSRRSRMLQTVTGQPSPAGPRCNASSKNARSSGPSFGGRPRRGASASRSRPPSRNHARQARTRWGAVRNHRATPTTGSPCASISTTCGRCCAWPQGRAPGPDRGRSSTARRCSRRPESGGHAGYDGAKRKRGSKVHAAVDTLGHLLALRRHAGRRAGPGPGGGRSPRAVQAATGRRRRAGLRRPGLHRPRAAGRRRGARHPAGGGQARRRPSAASCCCPAAGWWSARFAWARFRRLARDYERRLDVLAGLHLVAFASLDLAKAATEPPGVLSQ